VLDNPFYGTRSSQDTVDLTVVLMAAPTKWMREMNANERLNPEGIDLFDPEQGVLPYRGFPYRLLPFPIASMSKETINLCGYMGDWIVDDAWDLLQSAFEIERGS